MYIGNDLQVAESGNKIIDDISSSFNGSTTSFALLVGGAAPVPFPINTQQIYISVNGVIQEPDPTGSAGFKLLGNNIVFSSAPANGHAFFGVILSGADYVTVGTEFPAGSATAPSICFGNDNNTGLYSVTGGTMGFTSDGVQTFTLDGDGFKLPDNKKLLVGSSSDLEVYHDGSNSYIKDAGTGLLKILSSGVGIKNVADNAYSAFFGTSGAAELYYNGSKKIETTNTGTNVTGIHVDDGATHDGDVTFTGAAANVVWDKSEDDLIFNDNAKAAFGTSSDLLIWHNGTHSYIKDAGTGKLRILSNAVILGNEADDETLASFIEDGACNFYYDGSKKLETMAHGIRVSGAEGNDGVIQIYADEGDDNADLWKLNAAATGGFYLENYTSGAWETNIKAVGNGAVELYYDNAKKMETYGNGLSIFGHTWQNDNHKAIFGDGADLEIYHDSSHSNIINKTGNLYINASASDTALKIVPDGAVELYYDNSKKLETTSTGVSFNDGNITNVGSIALDSIKGDADDNTNITFGGSDVISFKCGSTSPALTVNTTQVKVEDNQKFVAGTGNDLEIYHDGNNFVKATNGYLNLASTTNTVFIDGNEVRMRSGDGGEILGKFIDDGAVELYYDNDRKLKTASNGVVIESATGDNYLTVQTEEDVNTADAVLRAWTKNTDASCYLMFGDNDDTFVGGFKYQNSNNKLLVYTNNATHWQWDSSGNFTSNSDSNKLQLGSGEDLELYHDGTNSYIKNNTGLLLIDGSEVQIRANGTEDAIKCHANGSVELYYDNNKKFETNSGGVEVTGGTLNMDSACMQFSGNLALPNVGACIFRPAADTVAFGINNGQRVSVNQYGLLFGTDTASANALDDYEEGTWTPSISFNDGTTGITYDTAGADATGGTYTKIGRQVTVHGTINLTSKGSSTGDARVHGLPFASSGDDNNRGSGSIGYVHGMSVDGPMLILEERGGNTKFYLRTLNANFDGSTTMTNSSFTNSSRFFFSLTYNT